MLGLEVSIDHDVGGIDIVLGRVPPLDAPLLCALVARNWLGAEPRIRVFAFPVIARK
jgi:hypothetical protein